MTSLAHTRPKSVLISTFNLYKGGSLSIYRAIEDRLVLDGVAVTELTFRDDPLGESKPRRRLRIPYPIPRLNKLYRLLIEHILVPLVALQCRAQRVVMMGNFPSLFWLGPQTVYFHNLLYLGQSFGQLRRGFFEPWLFATLLRLKRPTVLVQTDHVATRLIELFPTADVRVIGVPLGTSWSAAAQATQNRTAHSGRIILLYPASHYPHKNHALIFSVQEALRKRKIHVVLTIADIEPLRRLANSDVFTLCGVLSAKQLQKTMSDSDAVLFPSLEESIGMPLLEASLMRKPLLAAELPYVHAAVKRFYAFDPHSPEAFVKALDEFLADLRAERVRTPISMINTSAESFVSSLLS